MKETTIKFEMTREEHDDFCGFLSNAMENYWPEGWNSASDTYSKKEFESINAIFDLICSYYPESQNHIQSKKVFNKQVNPTK
jgi:hypothetical protein